MTEQQKVYTLKAAKAESNRLAFTAPDDTHFYVCALPEQPRRYAVVPEADYSRLARANAIGRVVYVQNGRHARMEKERIT